MDENQTEQKQGWSFQRYLMLGGIGFGTVILLPLFIGLIIAVVANPEPTAIRFGMIRDIVIIILALQGILIILALTVLILQVARLIMMLQDEIKPILDETRQTVETAKGTAQFVGKNITEPVIGFQVALAGIFTLIREMFGIRRAIRRVPSVSSLKETAEHDA